MHFVITFIVVVVLVIVAVVRLMINAGSEGDRRRRVIKTYSDPVLRQRILDKQIWLGMTEAQLLDSWGSPTRVTTQVLKTKVKTTYRFGNTYSGPSVYLDSGFVTGWRQSR